MPEHEADAVHEALHGTMRVAITVGGLMAERAMRAREQAARNAQAESEHAARELQARMDGERAAARAALAPVHQRSWWEKAGPDEVGAAWETATAWRELDPDAERAAQHIGDELRGRYAIQVDSLDADPGQVQAALERRERALRLSAEFREAARRDEAVAFPLLAAANRADREQERGARDAVDSVQAGDRAERLYDSAERRDELATELEGIGADEETIAARVVADTNQGQPPQQAVAGSPSRAPRARSGRGKGAPGRSATRRSERGR